MSTTILLNASFNLHTRNLMKPIPLLVSTTAPAQERSFELSAKHKLHLKIEVCQCRFPVCQIHGDACDHAYATVYGRSDYASAQNATLPLTEAPT